MKQIYINLLSVCFLLAFSISSNAQQTACTATILNFPTAACGAVTPMQSFDFGNANVSTTPNPGICPSNVWQGPHNDFWVGAYVPTGQEAIRFEMEWSGCGLFCVSNPGFTVYLATNNQCANLVPLLCEGDNSILPSTVWDVSITSLNPGDLVLVRAWEIDDQDVDFDVRAVVIPPNDFCQDALPLTGLGCNYLASDLYEPDTWAPNQTIFDNNCSGGDWSSNENGVWYTFTIDSTTPQPFSIEILNIICDATGAGTLQMGIWTNSNTCDLGLETRIDCAVGIGNVTLGPLTLVQGDYYLFVDGNAGANCVWEFESEIILPIQLSEFKGEMVSGASVLRWSTLSEVDNDFFEIQHSKNGQEFNTIGIVDGVGNSNQHQSYEFIHEEVPFGGNYYKLKQIDLSGLASFSNTIFLRKATSPIKNVYPNPVIGNQLNFDLGSFVPEEARLTLTDLSGRTVYQSSLESNASILKAELPNISKGVYIYMLDLGNYGRMTGKIIK